MAEVDLTKTQDIVVLSHQAVTHPATVVGSSQNVASKLSCTLVLYHAMVEAAANTNPGTFLVQVSPSASGTEDWATIDSYTTMATTPDTEAMTATEPIGETVMACASTTGFAVHDILYIQDTGTLADSEWARLKTFVTDTSISLVDGLTTQKDSSDVIWNDAQIFVTQLDLSSISRLRVVYYHEGAAGANTHIKALMSTGDSIG